MRVVSSAKGMNISQAFKRIAFASMLLEADLDFAYDAHLGYITSCPSLLGTALKIEVELNVPYTLTDTHLEIEKEYSVQFTQTTFPGDADEVLSNASSKAGLSKNRKKESPFDKNSTITVRNRATLGKTEVEICMNVHNAVKAYLE